MLSIEGTDCRLDELGRLADRTGGKVCTHFKLCCDCQTPLMVLLLCITNHMFSYVRAVPQVVVTSPNKLHEEFEQIIDNRTMATHCTVTLLLPQSL